MTTIAFAGRRVDAPDAPKPRFPLANAPEVERRLAEYFAKHRARNLVCSAACGADLLALKTAEAAGVRRVIVLPFDVETFRKSSVTDRPGDWGALYDRVIAAAASEGSLVVLDLGPGEEAAYDVATVRIVEEATRTGEVARACIVWEGASRGADDHSMTLSDAAMARGWPVDTIPTM